MFGGRLFLGAPTCGLVLCILALFSGAVEGDPCVANEIAQSVSVYVGNCNSHGYRDLRVVIKPDNYTCRAYSGTKLSVPEDAGDGSCNVHCLPGHKLALKPSTPHSPPDQLFCQQCPRNTFSVGGGHLISHWGPFDHRLATIQWKKEDFLKPIFLFPGFSSTCWGWNETNYQATHDTASSWVRGLKCEPWTPDLTALEGPGSQITSGENRVARRIWSEISIRLRFVKKGKMWFKFRVTADANPMSVQDCPWLNGDTGAYGQFKCIDGTYGDNSFYCNEHGGRAQCPSNFPIMCAQPGLCAGGEAYCCSIDCTNFGGPRLCPDTGGLQVLVCDDTRLRTCKLQPLLEPPFANRFYATEQLDWKWVEIELHPGWREIIFRYVRQGAVTGGDKAFIGEVGWFGTEWADTECTACPEGKQSAPGSDRCNSCPTDHAFNLQHGTCVKCPDFEYALPGSTVCTLRPPCSEQDWAKRYTECGDGNVRQVYYEWLEPKICKGGRPLPPAANGLPCEHCGTGRVRHGKKCNFCHEGKYSNFVENTCHECGAGHFAPLELEISEFSEWPKGMKTGCYGQCGTAGWRLTGSSIDSGTHHMAPAYSWVELDVNLTHPGEVTFWYQLACHRDFASFSMSVDGIHIPIEATCGKTHDHNETGHETIPLLGGVHVLRWTYSRVQNPNHTPNRRSKPTVRAGHQEPVKIHSGRPHYSLRADDDDDGATPPEDAAPPEDEAPPGDGDDNGDDDIPPVRPERPHPGAGVDGGEGNAHPDMPHLPHPGGPGILLPDLGNIDPNDLPDHVPVGMLPDYINDDLTTWFEGVAKITKIVLLNVDQGGSGQCLKCPAGSYSTGSTSRCTPCPVGHYSLQTAEGPQHCIPCPADTFAPVRGSPACRPCGPNSGSEPGASQCTAEFSVAHESSEPGETYNPTSYAGIIGPIWIPPENFQVHQEVEHGIYLSLSDVLVAPATGRMVSNDDAEDTETPVQCIGTYACISPIEEGRVSPHRATSDYEVPPVGAFENPAHATTINGGSSRGFEGLPDFLSDFKAQTSHDSSGIVWRAGGGVTVVFTDGAPCSVEEGEKVQTKLYMLCNRNEMPGQPEFMTYCGHDLCSTIDNGCTTHILWETAFGCPICTEESYVQLGTACIRGVRNVSYEFSHECYGGMPLPQDATNVRCDVNLNDMFTTADKVAMGIMGFLAIVVIFILAERYLLYKRLYANYRNMEPSQGGPPRSERGQAQPAPPSDNDL